MTSTPPPSTPKAAVLSSILTDKSKVTTTLGLIAAVAMGAFQFGASTASASGPISGEIAGLHIAVTKLTTILDRVERKQDEQARDLATLQRELSKVSADVQELRSRVP